MELRSKQWFAKTEILTSLTVHMDLNFDGYQTNAALKTPFVF